MEKEFKSVKEILNSPVYVKQFNVNKKNRIYTDASKLYGCACLLTQLTREVNSRVRKYNT